MRFTVSMKDPDTLDDAINDAVIRSTEGVACLTLFSCRDGSLAPAGEVDAGSVRVMPEEALRRLAVDLGLGFARGRIVAGVRRGSRKAATCRP